MTFVCFHQFETLFVESIWQFFIEAVTGQDLQQIRRQVRLLHFENVSDFEEPEGRHNNVTSEGATKGEVGLFGVRPGIRQGEYK